MTGPSRIKTINHTVYEPRYSGTYGKHSPVYSTENTCIMCGTAHIETGKIFHGHCVCEECVDYIVSSDRTSDQNVG